MKMKKFFFVILGIIVLAILLVIALNLFDDSLNPNVFTRADLPPASFDSANGFYIMWGLAEPEEVVLQSEEFTAPIRKMFDPEVRTINSVDTFDISSYRKKFNKYSSTMRAVDYPRSLQEDWISKLEPQAEQLEKSRKTCQVLLKRWRDLLYAPIVEDFTYPSPESPIPNLLPVLYTARLFTAIGTARAVNGQWQEGAADLISQVDFARRFLRRGRVLVNNMITRAVLEIAIQGLVSVLNHPQCPKEVFTLVLEKLPPLKYEEYGNRNSYICECLSFYNLLDEMSGELEKVREKNLIEKKSFFELLFLQVNTTKNYFYDYYSMALAYERQDPYLWQGDLEKEAKEFLASKGKILFWQLKNPVGKVIFSMGAVSTVYHLLFKSVRLRVHVDLVRILAELKLKYTPGQNAVDVLDQLDTYQTIDPCSGKPYKWNEEKKVLYSIGTDRTDDNGEEIMGTLKTDISIPVVLNH